MMKKLFLLGTTLLSFSTAVISQTATTTVVTDTLHYYYNKFYFRSNMAKAYGPTSGTVAAGLTASVVSAAPFYKSAAITFTGNSHMGNVFENPVSGTGDTLVVTGLEAVMSKYNSVSQIFDINARIYLCDLDAAGKPKLPPIDCVLVKLNSKEVRLWGGNFTTPRKLTKNFAVLVRNVSTIAGDTVAVYRTPATTHTNYFTPIQYRYSDSYGYMRHLGTFYSMTNYTVTPGFGVGSDYEFFVAPRVTYTLNVQQAIPDKIVNSETLCTSTPYTFTNVSSPRLTHRMYNLLQTYTKWSQPYAPFVNGPQTGWPADSAVSWKFDFEDNGSVKGGRLFLPYGANTISFQTDSVLDPKCSDVNFFRASLKKMGIYGYGDLLKFWEPINMCVDYCYGDGVGLAKTKGFEGVSIYPNPTSLGKTTINGLVGKNTIFVYDVLGQLIYKTTSSTDKVTIDLSNQPNGTYLTRLVNENNQSKAITLLKTTE
jgi:hypothetical protein